MESDGTGRAAAALRGRAARYVHDQVSAGRKNTIEWQVGGTTAALAWASDDPERLWAGHRGRPNEVIEKDPAIMTPAGTAAAAYPVGHVEGHPDTFRALFADIYRDIDAGAPSSAPDLPDVRRRPRRRAGVRGDQCLGPDQHVDPSRTGLRGQEISCGSDCSPRPSRTP